MAKVIEFPAVNESMARPFDIAALQGVANSLEAALKASKPFTLITTDHTGEWSREITREESLEFHIGFAIGSIYKLTGDEEE